MKERLVKGRHVKGILDLLQAHDRLETLPELAPPAADLVRKTVYPTTWYQLQAVEGLLQSVHRYVFDGSEMAGQEIGRLLAAGFLERSREPLPEGPLGVGDVLARYWKAHFNFGAVEHEGHDTGDGRGLRIRITGFPDMSACQGHLWMGWCTEVFRYICQEVPHLRVEERPWMHNSVLTYTLSSRAS